MNVNGVNGTRETTGTKITTNGTDGIPTLHT